MKGPVVVAVSAALLAGCSTFSSGAFDRSHPTSVAGYFSPPQAFPGPMWTRDPRYRLGALQLWLSPSHPSGAYLRVGKDIERWPRSDPTTECA